MRSMGWGIILGFLLNTQAAWAACDQTLSVGANVLSAVRNAANGSTICLNSGQYGSVSFDSVQRSGFVTIQSATDKGATINVQVGASSYLRFQNLTLDGAYIHACSHHIELRDSKFVDGLLFNNRDGICPAQLNLLVDGNEFGDLGGALWEGRLSIGDRDGGTNPMGLIVSNNHFHSGCRSDGIQLVGGAGGVTIGPGNIFENIIQSGPVHCDSIQFYNSGPPSTIIGNWFKNVSVALQHHPRIYNTAFRNNLFTDVAQIQVGTSPGFIFEHNTVYNLTDYFALSESSNITIRSNLILGRTAGAYLAASSGVYSHQMCQTSGQCFGANQIIGNPTFVGGAVPTTWAGWQLASNSLGKNAGHDGQDIGINYYGAGNVQPPPPVPPMPPADTMAPVISNVAPSGVLAAGSTSTTLSVTTDENANCRYSQTAGVSYANMANSFMATGAKNHTQQLTGLVNNMSYKIYVRCQDSAGNANLSDAVISFAVAAPPVPAPVLTAKISAPLNNARIKVRSVINIQAQVSTQVVKVEFYINDRLRSTDSSAANGFSLAWKPGRTGKRYLKIKAYDATGKSVVSPVILVYIVR